jgi:hypothetical protein
MRVLLAWVACFLLVWGCSGGSGTDAGTDAAPDGTGRDADGGTAQDADAGGDDAGGVDAGGDDAGGDDGGQAGDGDGDGGGGEDGGDPGSDEVVTHECSAGEKICIGHITRRFCADTPQGRRWQDEECAAGHGCVAGECVFGEGSDECNLGEEDSGRSCELYDISSGSWVEPDPGAFMHDRSRAYNMRLRRDSLYHGGVGNATYFDPPDYTDVAYWGGLGDSAIWTGSYLAAEALRLMDTGSQDARQNVKRLVETLHMWFNISGDPGVLARWVTPTGQGSQGELDCSEQFHHCGVSYQGESYDYLGHISRDQYQGVMLGYALAYEALGEHDEAHRALIREDVVELVEELMTERQVDVQITWNETDWPTRTITMRHAVLCTREMEDGAIRLIVDSGDFTSSMMWGFQEFMPNWRDMIHQLIPIWNADIPRADSGIMLPSFFRVAMLVTDGVPGYEAQNRAFHDYYINNPLSQGGGVDYWLSMADGWFYNDDCGGSYYANNIAMQPMHNWARLEDDPTILGRIRSEVLVPRMWPEHEHTKNCFFYYIYGANWPGLDPAVIQLANNQLAQFPEPPRIRVPVDLRNDARYPHDPDCTDQTTRDRAVDVGERVTSDFIWQRNPWGLYDAGHPALTYPGVDYLLAYWMGRYYGFIDDDTPGKCLAWH